MLVAGDFSIVRWIIKGSPQDLLCENTDGRVTAVPMPQSGQYHSLVMDWNMPGMIRIELLRSVRIG